MNNNRNWREYKREDSILFNSRNENCIFSNMYPCLMRVKEVNFYSSEQMFHYLLFEGFPKVQNEIMKCKGINNGFEVKKICKAYENLIKDLDKKEIYEYLYQSLKLKYKFCEDFKNAVDNSNILNIVEYASWGDTEYGTVYNKTKDVYEGVNVCGRLIMKLREEARNETSN